MKPAPPVKHAANNFVRSLPVCVPGSGRRGPARRCWTLRWPWRAKPGKTTLLWEKCSFQLSILSSLESTNFSTAASSACVALESVTPRGRSRLISDTCGVALSAEASLIQRPRKTSQNIKAESKNRPARPSGVSATPGFLLWSRPGLQTGPKPPRHEARKHFLMQSANNSKK